MSQVRMAGPLILSVSLLLVTGCGGRPSSAGNTQIEVTTEVLSDTSDRLKVVELTLSSTEPYRVVIADARGGDRDAAHISRSARMADDSPVAGRVLIVADLVRLGESDHDVLTWLIQISGGGVIVAGPSQSPVPKGSKLADLVEVFPIDGASARGQSRQLVRIRDQVFHMRVE